MTNDQAIKILREMLNHPKSKKYTKAEKESALVIALENLPTDEEELEKWDYEFWD